MSHNRVKIEKISKSATMFTFDSIENYLTSVFLIEKNSKNYLIDTFCGSDSMEPIISRLSNKKELVIINTHFHWDHIWGNCSFKESNIISHKLCRKLSEELWEKQINNNGKYIDGRVEKFLPNITFEGKITFEKDDIELFYSPGHTIDSISIFDKEEEILYVGDNLEKPIVYVENNDVPTYVKTLENYLKYNAKKIFASHTSNLSEKDILTTIKYLKELTEGKEFSFQSEYTRAVHEENMKMVHKSEF